jgi:hypothetical protein
VKDSTYLVDLRQVRHIRAMQHSQCQANHLQILGSRCRGNIPWFCAHVINDTPLQPGEEEMRSLADDFFLDSGQTVEYNGACAALDIVHGGIDGEGACNRDGEPPKKSVGRCHLRDMCCGGGWG